MLFTLLPALLFLPSALAAPAAAPIVERAYKQCGQYQQQYSGSYVLSTNGWGWSSASPPASYNGPSGNGNGQCSEIDSLNGNTISWDTNWQWNGTVNQVKSYTNVQASISLRQLSSYSSMPTSWQWSYTGGSLRCNVAYDTFVGASTSGANLFEVMVWLGVYGGVSPLSANGYPFTPIATPTIGGVPFDLAYGTNGNVKVYSFVAHSRAASNFNGDLLNFYKYLEAHYGSNGFSSSLYLQSIQAGTEVFTGTNALLTTSAYSVSVN